MLLKPGFLAMALIVFSAMVVSVGFAEDVGVAEYRLVTTILTGALGNFVGLVVTLVGLWTLLAGRNANFGMVLMVLGALIMFLPDFYNGTRDIVCPIARALDAPCGEEGSAGKVAEGTKNSESRPCKAGGAC